MGSGSTGEGGGRGGPIQDEDADQSPPQKAAPAMSIAVLRTELHVLNMRTRMPFQYGIATLTALPHLFLRVEIQLGSQRSWGIASEGLAPKWFTKDPDTSFRDDLDAMLAVIRWACGAAQGAGPQPSVFALWKRVSREQQERWGGVQDCPPLLWGLGVSLVERALISAWCRAKSTSFPKAVLQGGLGIDLGDVHGLLRGRSPADYLPASPSPRLTIRHTVGLADPLEDTQIPPGERLEDGLPQSLESCIRTYGLTHLKVKLSGDLERDSDRLGRIASLMAARGGRAAFTLDANEHFRQVDAFRQHWESLGRIAALEPVLARLLFVEQPLHRDVALSPSVAEDLRTWSDRPPIIIDESDGELRSLPLALECGYSGTSHKNCKGVLKSIANACLLAHLRRSDRDRHFILSAEDLANVGPVALLEDLATIATLGIEHAERNGHHYFAGLSMFEPEVQAQVVRVHGDLYRRHDQGFAALHITNGTIHFPSVLEAPYGIGFDLDTTRFTPLDAWSFESLT